MHIICLHSSQSSGAQWRPLTKQLTEFLPDANLHTPDLIGYGGNPLPKGSSSAFCFDHELAALEPLLATLENGPVHLVGHSYGGALALRLGRELQQRGIRLSSIALYEPVAFHLLPAADPARAEIIAIAEQMETTSEAEAAQAFVDYWNHPGYFAALPARVQAGMVQKQPKVEADFAALLGEPAQLNDYATLNCPIFLMHGQQSPASSRRVAEILAGLPQVVSQSVNAGHMAPLTEPDLVIPGLVKFLQQQVR
ncbi:alpha/beta fold hydrolase [Aliidiomarina soli]|uniref:Alpha/beta hydrolase n=1 Tax=Aliidiomarina soli TaxID=1928574 RepID=A0A432WGW6_9GAMM|nr:alpha/beta hydrolase [Aliidiomarina soli]RUO33014.1 alpha/beta hydrolase [Aliidiomarina soli]